MMMKTKIHYPKFQKNEFFFDLLKEYDLWENDYYVSHESAIRWYFHLKHPSSVIIITNNKIEKEVNEELYKIFLVKKDKIKEREFVQFDWINYQNPYWIFKDYIENKDLFLKNCLNKDEVEIRMEEIFLQDREEILKNIKEHERIVKEYSKF